MIKDLAGINTELSVWWPSAVPSVTSAETARRVLASSSDHQLGVRRDG